MDSDATDRVVFNAIAASAMSEAQRLLCVAAGALARDAARECTSALMATHQVVSQLEQNLSELWINETASEASHMQGLLDQDAGVLLEDELWDDSAEGPTTQEEN